MKKSRFTEEQIIGFLRQVEAGMPIKEPCRQGGFSHATFYKWRAKYGGMQASRVRHQCWRPLKPPGYNRAPAELRAFTPGAHLPETMVSRKRLQVTDY